MEPNELAEGLKFGESRLKCAKAKGLENCKKCKETLREIWDCEEWLKYDSAFARFKRRLGY